MNMTEFEARMKGAFDRLSQDEANAVNLIIAGYQLSSMSLEELQDLIAHISDKLLLRLLTKI